MITKEITDSNKPMNSLIMLMLALHRFGVIRVWSSDHIFNWNEIRTFGPKGILGRSIRQRFIDKKLLNC